MNSTAHVGAESGPLITAPETAVRALVVAPKSNHGDEVCLFPL